MKRKLLNKEQLSCLALMFFGLNFSFGQQTIGQFPVMDGGFESQVISNIGSITPHATDWTISTSPASVTRDIITNPAVARSGNKYVSFSNAASGSTRLQSPIASTLAVSTQYTVQYYFKAAVSPLAYLTGAIYINGSGANAPIIPKPAAFVANTWIKASATFTSTATAGATRFASPRINGTTNTSDIVNIDDFVVYAGPLDETAPDSPSTPTVNGLDVSWTAPGTGVDGGGYVVVRYATLPAADNNPKQNGIYKIGNTLTEGTASLVGTVVYIGTNTSFTDNVAGSVSGSDFYKVYAVDKAFNYSSAATLKTNQWSMENPISIYPTPVKNNQFTVSLPASTSGKVIVRIYNMSGQLVYKTAMIAVSNSIEVHPAQQLTVGIYIVKIENNGNISDQKITIN
jgi:hypothetical protein